MESVPGYGNSIPSNLGICPNSTQELGLVHSRIGCRISGNRFFCDQYVSSQRKVSKDFGGAGDRSSFFYSEIQILFLCKIYVNTYYTIVR